MGDGGTATSGGSRAQAGATVVLVTLAAGQFLMTLDTSVMNVAIATVAEDVGTDVTGIQTAITLYTLVMATLMITGGKVGALIGRKRAFAIGCVIYGAGSFTTSISPSLPVLLIGWSLLEGVGAALILPAIVALVAANFPPAGRPRAYGLVMAAGAIAVAVGPLVGGLFTTYLSWRLVFAGEVLIVLAILALTRRIEDEAPGERPSIDVLGIVLSAAGLGLAVFGVLRSSVWGWVSPKPDAPELFGVSAVLWLVLGGLVLIWLFFVWESRLERRGAEPLVRPSIFRTAQLVGGLEMFFFQYFVQAGVFFVVPLFLSIALGLSAIDTGVRLLPLSVTLLIAAAGIPRFRPDANPRRVVRLALLAMLAGTVVLIAGIDKDASAEVVTVPLLLLGLGIGALASQLGSVTVSSVPDELSPEVGGLQNTATNIGASLGTALAGSMLIASLTTTLVAGIQENPDVPPEVRQRAQVELSAGVPFISDADLKSELDKAGVSDQTATAIIDENADARLKALRTALAIVALVAALALFFSGGIPTRQPGSEAPDPERGPPAADPRPA
jgi:EmrB/QacA subfamily drug resistance transporter